MHACMEFEESTLSRIVGHSDLGLFTMGILHLCERSWAVGGLPRYLKVESLWFGHVPWSRLYIKM